MKTASDDASILTLACKDDTEAGSPDGESIATSEMDSTEFDFDLEVINTAAYRKVFNMARSKLRSGKGSQVNSPPHLPTLVAADTPQTANLYPIDIPSAMPSVVASQRNNFSHSRPNTTSQDSRPRFVPPEDSVEGVLSGSGGLQVEQHDAKLHDQPKPSPERKKTRFGDYILGQTIGKGGIGKVKIAWRKDSTLPVAIKLMRREPADPSHLLKLYYKISILHDLSHPNIARIIEVVETERRIAVVLEYASGGNLAEYVTALKYLKAAPARRIFAQIISGVGYLHQKGILHLALSSHKVVLDRNRNVILVGFSHANTFNPQDMLSNDAIANISNDDFVERHRLDQQDEHGFMRGDLMLDRLEAPHYSAPEGSLCRSYEGRKADVWSCGIILVSP